MRDARGEENTDGRTTDQILSLGVGYSPSPRTLFFIHLRKKYVACFKGINITNGRGGEGVIKIDITPPPPTTKTSPKRMIVGWLGLNNTD